MSVRFIDAVIISCRPVSGNLSDFIRAPLIANGRDHLDNVYVKTPVELWNQKTLSYIDVVLKVKNACLVRYEDLVEDTVGFIRWLGQNGLVFDHDDIVQVASTKRDSIDFTEYRAKALNFDPCNVFDRDDFDFIRSQIPQKLATLLGYEQGRTNLPKSRWPHEMFSYLAT